MSTHRTITLTGRPPVRILEAEWPVIADARWRDHEGQHDRRASLKVRQHADGRAIVYGVWDYEITWQLYRAGVLLDPGADLASAITEVALSLADRGADEARMRDLAHGCTADLPAEEL